MKKRCDKKTQNIHKPTTQEEWNLAPRDFCKITSLFPIQPFLWLVYITFSPCLATQAFLRQSFPYETVCCKLCDLSQWIGIYNQLTLTSLHPLFILS